MAEQDQYLEVRPGDTLPIDLTIKDSKGEAVPLTDLQGEDLKFVLSRAGVDVLTKIIGNGIAVTDAGKGEVTITLDAADTVNLVGVYRWNVVLTTTSEQVFSVADGRLFTLGAEPVSLTMAKSHLKVEHEEDDALIASLITAARELAESYIGRSLATETASSYELGYAPDSVPGPIRLAILRIVATHYENREDEVVGTVVARLSEDAKALLDPYRVVGL